MSDDRSNLFTEGWRNYRLVLEHDYLWHSLAESGLHETIVDRFGRDTAFAFLDLACGDAETTARVLRDFDAVEYVGVDSSPQALEAAAATNFGKGVRTRFVLADYVDFLNNDQGHYDVIFVGMSAHHLGERRLPEFFELVRKRLARDGLFVAYEPFLLADETRDEQIARLHAVIGKFWSAMPAESRRSVVEHTASADFPVSLEVWNAAAEAAGLPVGRFVRKSPDRLYAMVIHG